MEKVLAKLDALREDIHRLDVKIAGLSEKYVRREEFDQYRNSALSARRWAVSTLISVVTIGVMILASVLR